MCSKRALGSGERAALAVGIININACSAQRQSEYDGHVEAKAEVKGGFVISGAKIDLGLAQKF